ncbi:hypothetical protein EJK50_1874 [Moraxella catarrhalis]|nr:hypothetical protein EJK50_1874 [Moraxella catarrhalis]
MCIIHEKYIPSSHFCKNFAIICQKLKSYANLLIYNKILSI